jgi:hypothetical protein
MLLLRIMETVNILLSLCIINCEINFLSFVVGHSSGLPGLFLR